MADRFYLSTPPVGSRATLEGPEAHHLLHVMRAREGDGVTLFDGSGTEMSARIEQCGRAEVVLEVIESRSINRELGYPITLGVSLPKGDRQKWLVEKAVELGVSRIVPLITERGVAQPKSSALARLERSVIEASKQCGRNRLMEIAPPVGWDAFLRDRCDATACWVAHPGGSAPKEVRAAGGDQVPNAYRLAIGPEGGFSDAEISEATNAGWQTIDLGPRILRIETAAALLVAMVVSTQPGD